MKKDIKILLVDDGTNNAVLDLAKAFAGTNVTTLNEPVFYIINHYSDDTGFFNRMQDYLPIKETKKGKKNKPFYWGLRSKKELRELGIS